MHKKLIQIDLDGVLNDYDGNYQEDTISSLKNGAYEFLESLSQYYKIDVFTVRDRDLCIEWLKTNDIYKFINDVTNIKNLHTTVMLDDRAINFDGSYQKAYKQIIDFKPYWKK